MADSDISELYTSIEEAALATYGELLAPELAHAAATSFAKEAHDMVTEMLSDSAGVLRERIEGQLAALTGAPAKPAKKKRVTKKALAAPAVGAPAEEAPAQEAAEAPRKRGPKPKAS